MKRREFVRGALGLAGAAWLESWQKAFAEAAADPAVGKVWQGWKPGEYQVHFICTGVSESALHIFPDGTTMLLDCGDVEIGKDDKRKVPALPDETRHGGEWSARYVARVAPHAPDVDYMMSSHFHGDHVGYGYKHAVKTTGRGEDYFLNGFGEAAETLRFHKAIDRGWPDYQEPYPCKMPEMKNMRTLYAWLMKKGGFSVEKFRLGAVNQIALLHDPAAYAKSFSIRNVCCNGKIATPEGGRYLYEGFDWSKNKSDRENGMSLGIVVQYGAFRLYTGGDFSDIVPALNGKPAFWLEDEIAPIIGPVNVCKVNHHGVSNTMPAKLVKTLRAQVYVSCVWNVHHNWSPAMDRLADKSLYPGERLICPTIMPVRNRAVNGKKPWMADVPKAAYEGGHVVVNVEPGGKDYTVSYLTAADESMRVRAVFHFNA